jgi:hypothetical protein
MKKYTLCLFTLALFFSACKKESGPDNNQNYRVKYNIGCTDCTVIYYYDEFGNDTAVYHKNSSWSYTFDGKKGQSLILFATNTSNTPQGITVTISVNDSVTETETRYCAISGDAFVNDTI